MSIKSAGLQKRRQICQEKEIIANARANIIEVMACMDETDDVDMTTFFDFDDANQELFNPEIIMAAKILGPEKFQETINECRVIAKKAIECGDEDTVDIMEAVHQLIYADVRAHAPAGSPVIARYDPWWLDKHWNVQKVRASRDALIAAVKTWRAYPAVPVHATAGANARAPHRTRRASAGHGAAIKPGDDGDGGDGEPPRHRSFHTPTPQLYLINSLTHSLISVGGA